MIKMFKSSLIVLSLLFISTSLSADIEKGQKIIIKKLKKDCGFSGSILARKNTQDKWEEIFKAGKLNKELKRICPNSKPLKGKYIPHVYDFLYNYALDSGNVPS